MKFLNEWQKLSSEEKSEVFRETGIRKGLPAGVIEKDWWVSMTLNVIFNMDIASHLIFKGGTSLSKAWQIIVRFSEDIDLALNHRPENIQLNPPKILLKDWKKDYEDMRANMIHEESLTFEDLMNEINLLQSRINSLNI